MIDRRLLLATVACVLATRRGSMAETVMSRDALVTRLIPLTGNDPRSVDLRIQFALNSSEILPESEVQLEELAAALMSEKLMHTEVEIVGHTDALGSTEANAQLSERRASAVLDYLVGQGVESQRLNAFGRGEEDLLVDVPALDPANRRVEIIVKRSNAQRDRDETGPNENGYQAIN